RPLRRRRRLLLRAVCVGIAAGIVLGLARRCSIAGSQHVCTVATATAGEAYHAGLPPLAPRLRRERSWTMGYITEIASTSGAAAAGAASSAFIAAAGGMLWIASGVMQMRWPLRRVSVRP